MYRRNVAGGGSRALRLQQGIDRNADTLALTRDGDVVEPGQTRSDGLIYGQRAHRHAFGFVRTKGGDFR